MKLAEMTSDEFADHLRSFSDIRVFVKCHMEELETVVLEIKEKAKRWPVPPNIIIRCKDGEKMSIPVFYNQFYSMVE